MGMGQEEFRVAGQNRCTAFQVFRSKKFVIVKLHFQVCSRKCYLLAVQVIEGGEYCDTFSHGQSFCLMLPDFWGQ
jgi:hypothetical protein